MTPFLKEAAEDILRNHTQDMNRVCIVFPNKRTRMFFRKYYAQILGKTSWAAKFIDLKTLVSSIAGLNETDRLSTIFDLYEIFKKYQSPKTLPLSFDRFYHTGEIILNDFDEIDSWLVDSELIFKNIRNINEIDSSFDWLSSEQKEIILNFWKNFSPEHLSDEKTKFLEMLKILPKIHKELTELLLGRKSGYAGMLFRSISDSIDKGANFLPEYETLIFIGFNALTRGEEKLFRHFQKQGRAKFYWDTDDYYTSDLKQEAGDFIRKNFRTFGSPTIPLPENFKKSAKNIDLIGVPQNTAQAKIIAALFDKYQITKPDIETAIVLSDENLLFPILYSLPSSVEKLNVTMGFPLRETGLHGLISLYLKLQENLQKNTVLQPKINYSLAISILKHSYVYNFSEASNRELIEELMRKNQLFVEISLFSNSDNELIRLIFGTLPLENPGMFMLSNLMNILVIIFNNTSEKNKIGTLEKEFFFRAYMKIKRLKEILINKNISAEFELITKLLRQVLQSEQVPFKGDAIEGMQLMGVLETRNLDFENVIILGLNEGNFPKSVKPQTFLSQNIRYAFDMPVEKYRDSVYAYFFYRLLQRAKNICLVYNTVSGGDSGGEMSRFIKQLLFESNLSINQIQIKQDLKPIVPKSISIKKDTNVFRKLEDFTEINNHCKRRFSATALNDFIDCPLKFYFKYIAELKSPRKPEEDLSASDFGTIFHDTLEKLYGNLQNESGKIIVNKTDFKHLRERVPEYIIRSFAKQFGNRETGGFEFEGYQIIVKEVMQKYIETLLEFDALIAPFEILNLEDRHNFNHSLTIGDKKVGIKGTFDRIDILNGEYRIVDYKTGKPEKYFSDFDAVFSPGKTGRAKEIFQIFLYGWLCRQKLPKTIGKIVPVLYDVKRMNEPDFSPFICLGTSKIATAVDSTQFEAFIPEFIARTGQLLERIFDSEEDFMQTEKPEICQYCDFKTICQR